MALSPVDKVYQQLSRRYQVGIGVTKPDRRLMNQIVNSDQWGMDLLDYVGKFVAFSEREWSRFVDSKRYRDLATSRKPEDKQKLAKGILSVVKEEDEKMSNQNVNKMVDAAKNKDGAAFQSAFRTVMADKVTAALDAARQEIAQNTFGGLKEAKLTYAQRKALPDTAFAIPDRGGDEEDDAYPIHDKAHARNALARVAAHGTPAEKAKVRAAVKKKFPDIGEK